MNRYRVLGAFLIAPVVPALIAAAPGAFANVPLSSVWPILFLAGLVTYAHAVLLGLPAAWALSRVGPLTLLRVVVAAFAVGAMPFGAFTLYQEVTMPLGSGYVADGVVLRENGHLTAAGLQSALVGIVEAGIFGAIAGLVWWFVAKPTARNVSHGV
jgi:hypothetical protein